MDKHGKSEKIVWVITGILIGMLILVIGGATVFFLAFRDLKDPAALLARNKPEISSRLEASPVPTEEPGDAAKTEEPPGQDAAKTAEPEGEDIAPEKKEAEGDKPDIGEQPEKTKEPEKPLAEGYYEFGNSIREDLSYRVLWESAETEQTGDMGGTLQFSMEYPRLEGDGRKIELINSEISKEYNEISGMLGELADLVDENLSMRLQIDSYVPFMDEDLISVFMVENIYYEEDLASSYILSMNFDLHTGILLDNTKILNITEGFAEDFMKRSLRQNGRASYEDLSIEELTAGFRDPDSLILFYTDYGMEIGVNYTDGWVTVTYPDYQKFLTQL